MAQTIELSIDGMTCDHCVNAVTSALKSVPGVADATVSLAGKFARITGEGLDAKKLIEAVREEGYEAAVR
ncbi:heavy-metal-associated domain-containing protein [Tepidiforma sp.]|uniref:CopZ family metallochaperone n=1 Tax=Tepidiforma sp. TaxID=2682230 RepID=UPI002ADE255D|nr:heavy-metal-associated domain-containing protein [Tepidiforma sp.]